ncbi:YeiH family protein [Ancylobacter terrae]|uniref:YeiH family protein n=1 Tax=Ancylobacter sp. sgz301288 TaxID=3342077 RepID=UPI00385CEC24
MFRSIIAGLPEGPVRGFASRGPELAPGLLVSVTIAMASTFLSDHYGGPVMLFALLLGIAFNFLSAEGRCEAGIGFAGRTVLRFGVGLLGARITLDEVMTLGPTPLVVAVAGVALTLLCGLVVARAMGFNRDFGILTGGAVGICGASAALALSSVLPRRAEDGPARADRPGISERDTIFTVLGVTTLSTVAMVVYPILASMLGLGDRAAGIFLGATIHDVAQVVGAGYSISTQAGDAATLTKLLRVAMLVPVVLALTLVLARGGGGASGQRARFPFFLVAFVALVAINSLGLIPPALGAAISDLSRWSLVTAIAALGMRTALKDLAAVGPKALALLVIESVWIAAIGLGVVMLG